MPDFCAFKHFFQRFIVKKYCLYGLNKIKYVVLRYSPF